MSRFNLTTTAQLAVTIACVWQIGTSAADEPLAVAVRVTLARLDIDDLPDWRIELNSTVPPGRGLGSSAAVAVAIVRAVAAAAGAALDDLTVSELALASEQIVHGRYTTLDLSIFGYDRLTEGRRVIERNVIG